MSLPTTHTAHVVTPTPAEARHAEIARVGLMAACPFFAYYFYAEMKEVFTDSVPTAATDGRHVFINPTYLATLKPAEAVFVYAHEIEHVVCRDPQRMKTYETAGGLGGKPWDATHFNIVADYCRNAALVETGVGMMNPAWCWADDVDGDQLPEDVYVRKWKNPPPNPAGGKTGPGTGQGPGTTRGQSKADPKGATPDKAAQGQGHQDQLLPPPVDPLTGREDVPTPTEFKEAIARAAAAAKAMGSLPERFRKMVDEILDPQVDWREHVRMLLTGRMGSRRETWDRPNRRRLALNPIIITPGKRGYGAETVCVVMDTSGSIFCAPKAIEAFLAEVGGVLADVRPRRVILIDCDAEVQRVEEANTLDELEVARQAGVQGGGGTSFIPPFEYLAEQGIVPETTIYLTDLYGSFPDKVSHPVVWCTISDAVAPAHLGETVKISI